jgi:methylated-DNA-[protein]-cysteine S-methyltransferase
MKTQIVKIPIRTTSGIFLAHYSDHGLVELNFPYRYKPGSETGTKSAVTPQIREWHKITVTTLKEMLAGKLAKKFPPMDPAGTEFQKSVWRAMQKIPAGQTKSYGDVAKAIGKPRAVRAVGGACGANPIPVFVPCHRVLAANKKIGGFSSGLHWKFKLLELEGIKL